MPESSLRNSHLGPGLVAGRLGSASVDPLRFLADRVTSPLRGLVLYYHARACRFTEVQHAQISTLEGLGCSVDIVEDDGVVQLCRNKEPCGDQQGMARRLLVVPLEKDASDQFLQVLCGCAEDFLSLDPRSRAVHDPNTLSTTMLATVDMIERYSKLVIDRNITSDPSSLESIAPYVIHDTLSVYACVRIARDKGVEAGRAEVTRRRISSRRRKGNPTSQTNVSEGAKTDKRPLAPSECIRRPVKVMRSRTELDLKQQQEYQAILELVRDFPWHEGGTKEAFYQYIRNKNVWPYAGIKNFCRRYVDLLENDCPGFKLRAKPAARTIRKPRRQSVTRKLSFSHETAFSSAAPQDELSIATSSASGSSRGESPISEALHGGQRPGAEDHSSLPAMSEWQSIEGEAIVDGNDIAKDAHISATRAGSSTPREEASLPGWRDEQETTSAVVFEPATSTSPERSKRKRSNCSSPDLDSHDLLPSSDLHMSAEDDTNAPLRPSFEYNNRDGAKDAHLTARDATSDQDSLDAQAIWTDLEVSDDNTRVSKIVHSPHVDDTYGTPYRFSRSIIAEVPTTTIPAETPSATFARSIMSSPHPRYYISDQDMALLNNCEASPQMPPDGTPYLQIPAHASVSVDIQFLIGVRDRLLAAEKAGRRAWKDDGRDRDRLGEMRPPRPSVRQWTGQLSASRTHPGKLVRLSCQGIWNLVGIYLLQFLRDELAVAAGVGAQLGLAQGMKGRGSAGRDLGDSPALQLSEVFEQGLHGWEFEL